MKIFRLFIVILLLLKRLIVLTKDTGFSKIKTNGAYF